MKRCRITRSTIADKCQIRFQRSVSRLKRWIIVSIGLGAVVALTLLLSTTGGRWSAAFWRRSCSFRFIYSSIELKSVWLSSSSSIVSCTYWLLVCVFCLLDCLLVFLLVVGCCIAISRWACFAYTVLSRRLFLGIPLYLQKLAAWSPWSIFCILIDLNVKPVFIYGWLPSQSYLLCRVYAVSWLNSCKMEQKAAKFGSLLESFLLTDYSLWILCWTISPMQACQNLPARHAAVIFWPWIVGNAILHFCKCPNIMS